MKSTEREISKDKFVFAKMDGKLHDLKLETKPVGYLKDAFYRFKKNKASIVAGILILVILLFAIIVPIFSQYTVSYNDPYYRFTLPKNELFAKLDIPFWDGCSEKEYTKENFYYYYGMGVETGHEAVKNQDFKIVVRQNATKRDVTYYQFRLDSYHLNGVVFMNLEQADYNAIQAYQDETGIQVIFPITDPTLRPKANQDNRNANYWYRTEEVNGKTVVDFEGEDGNYVNIYQSYSGGDEYTSTVRVEGEEKLYDYAIKNQTGYSVRVNYYEYYRYYHTAVAKDGIETPSFLFGTTNFGQDIFTCLASGARFSLLMAIFIASINLIVGAIIGAIEGYYGGKIDLIIERIIDVLAAVPFMIIITLLKYHMEGSSQLLILFIAFFITGWIGMAGRTRMQFYRFKNQEYVLAARTLGAKDKRIMFKHIFPNALGTLITSCVLIIPGMIFTETSLSYLGIINLNSGSMTSVGTLLANGQQYLVTYPHLILFPAVFISILMLSFNLFGNGLRDAFNPSLRGTEE